MWKRSWLTSIPRDGGTSIHVSSFGIIGFMSRPGAARGTIWLLYRGVPIYWVARLLRVWSPFYIWLPLPPPSCHLLAIYYPVKQPAKNVSMTTESFFPFRLSAPYCPGPRLSFTRSGGSHLSYFQQRFRRHLRLVLPCHSRCHSSHCEWGLTLLILRDH